MNRHLSSVVLQIGAAALCGSLVACSGAPDAASSYADDAGNAPLADPQSPAAQADGGIDPMGDGASAPQTGNGASAPPIGDAAPPQTSDGGSPQPGASSTNDSGAAPPPPTLGDVSSATVCLAGGSIHDPNPTGCDYSGDCKYSPLTDNSDWDKGRWKFQCDAYSWMQGVSTRASDLHAQAFWCAMRPDLTVSVSSWENVAPGSGSGSSTSDWDPGYTKAECPANKYMSGFSVNTSGGGTGSVGNIRCVEAASEGSNLSCHGVTFSQYPPSGDVGFADGTFDWSPNAFKLQCGPSEHMAGMSTTAVNGGRIHGILCCAGGPPAAVSSPGSNTCCSTTNYNNAVTACLANPAANETACNLVDYCCETGVSALAGSASCAQAESVQDPNTEGGSGITVNPSSSSAPSAANGSWNLVAEKSNVRGNYGFGGGYDAITTLSATKATLQATGKAELLGYATLFGKELKLADIEGDGRLSTQTVNATVNVIGMDLWSFNQAGITLYSFDKGYAYTFFNQSKTFTVGPVPVTVAGSVVGTVGLGGSIGFQGGQISAGAGPYLDVTATASAALGGGFGPFELEAGVEGSLSIFNASLANTITVKPGTASVVYSAGSNLTITELNGEIDLFVDGTLELVFAKYSKKWTHTIVSFTAAQQVEPFLNYNGTMAY